MKLCNFSLIQQRTEVAGQPTNLTSKARSVPPRRDRTDRTGALAYLGKEPLDSGRIKTKLKYLINC